MPLFIPCYKAKRRKDEEDIVVKRRKVMQESSDDVELFTPVEDLHLRLAGVGASPNRDRG